MNDRIPKPGEIYKHFKNRLYQIITVAIHTESNEKMVVYQALYGDFKTYVRPLSMFISEVDKNKYPEVQQKYRFELVTLENNEDISPKEVKIEPDKEPEDMLIRKEISEIMKEPEKDESVDNKTEGEVNSILLDFLDADSYGEKLIILTSNKKYITDQLLNDMAASMDCTVEDGDIEDRYNGLLFCLQTFARFESSGLR